MDTKPWLKNYDEGLPRTLQPYPSKTLIDVMQESVKAWFSHFVMSYNEYYI